jgi:hypothetical protein
MKCLTEEQAERAARACGWTFHEYIRDHGTWGRLLEPSCWQDETGKWIPGTCTLLNNGYSDPHFWFGKLWDRAMDLAMEVGYDVEIYIPTDHSQKDTLLITLHGDKWSGGDVKHLPQIDHPCLALCAAIEELEAQCKSK